MKRRNSSSTSVPRPTPAVVGRTALAGVQGGIVAAALEFPNLQAGTVVTDSDGFVLY
jgi:hypothetical protein